jgi:FkbM family methyltransferase
MTPIFFDFKTAEKRNKEIDAYFNKLKSPTRGVYIFGVGEYADKLKQYLQTKGIFVKGYVVNDHFANKLHENVLPLSKIAKLDNVSIIYGLESGYSRWFYKKIDQIKKEMIGNNNSDFFVPSDYWRVEQGDLYLNHELIDSTFLKGHFDEFEATFKMLADERSKNVMTEYLYASVCRDASQLAQFGLGWDYDYDLKLLFNKKMDGIVVECGAFDGKTITEVSEFTDNKYDMIALECDSINYQKCCEKVEGYPNITVLKLGAWDKKAKLAMVQLDSGSYLREVDDSDKSMNVVNVIDIDSLANTKKIGAIIMDIEGSELKALMGAQTAMKNGASLAVRVYHKREDLITIPQYIRKINKNYKIFLRFERGANLCRTGIETTLYAICE